MATTSLQRNTQSFANSASARTLQYSSNVTSGSLLVAFIGLIPGSGTAQTNVTVSDNVNGSWTQAGTYTRNTNQGTQCSIWYFVNSGGGSRPTITVTPAASAAMGIALHEYSVDNPTGVTLDSTVNNTLNATTTTTPATGTCTVNGTGELVVGGFCQTSGGLASITVNSPFTMENSTLSAAAMSLGTAYDPNASSSEQATFTVTAIAVKFAAMAASFVTAAAGGGPAPHHVRRRLEGGLIHMGGGVI